MASLRPACANPGFSGPRRETMESIWAARNVEIRRESKVRESKVTFSVSAVRFPIGAFFVPVGTAENSPAFQRWDFAANRRLESRRDG